MPPSISIVLLSAGLDSLVSLYMAHKDGPVRLILTFDYGQRAAAREIEKAAAVSRALGIDHQVIDLPWLANLSKSALTDQKQEVPELCVEDLKNDGAFFERTAKQVWVPNRNGVFVNVAAAYAEQLGASRVVAGFNREEAVTFPDNGPQFIAAATESMAWSTIPKIKVWSYLSGMNKAQVVKMGVNLGVDFGFLWSCYHGGQYMCGKCESCSRMIRAFNDAGYPQLLPSMEGECRAKYISRRKN